MEDGLTGQSGANVMLIAGAPEIELVITQHHCLVVRIALQILRKRRVHFFAMGMTAVHRLLTTLDALKRPITTLSIN